MLALTWSQCQLKQTKWALGHADPQSPHTFKEKKQILQQQSSTKWKLLNFPFVLPFWTTATSGLLSLRRIEAQQPLQRVSRRAGTSSRAPGGVAGFVFVWDVVSNLPLSVSHESVHYWWFSPTEQAWRIDILFSTAARSTLLFVPRVKANPIICSCSSTWLCTMKSSTFFLLVAEMTTYGTLPFGIDEVRCLHIPYPNVALKGHGFGKGLCRENQNRAPTHAAGTHSWLQTDSLCPCNTTATATCEHSSHWAQIATGCEGLTWEFKSHSRGHRALRRKEWRACLCHSLNPSLCSTQAGCSPTAAHRYSPLKPFRSSNSLYS